ncbi:MAG TPA: hypothetical protein VFE32_15180 [Puia sp.]|jgi:hypothetical protein|nr:hypothetical protein [Puia sp.]
MQPKLLLRIAAVLMLMHTIGHMYGALGHSLPPDPKLAAIISGMQTEHFNFMGRSASLGLFFTGYGMTIIFVLLLIAVQLWILSARPSRPIAVILGLYLITQAVIEYIYFFPMAAAISLAAAVLTLLAGGTVHIRRMGTEAVG